MTEFVMYFEVAVRCFCEVQKEERPSKWSDGCPSAVGIERIEIEAPEGKLALTLEDLTNHILDEHPDAIEMEAWERLD